ncbi:hypothetical protein PM082_016012 [Marasmius tenuissimus]|nr:hypothetical protein PM082_016012 [Marasmius tenuissimus]
MTFITAVVLVTSDVVDPEVSREPPGVETGQSGMEVGPLTFGIWLIFNRLTASVSNTVRPLLFLDLRRQFVNGDIRLKLLDGA